MGKQGVHTLQDSLLYFFNVLCIPSVRDHRKQIMEDLHDSRIGGHFSFLKTFQRIKNRYYWPSMCLDVYEFVWKCPQCLANKYERVKPGLLFS